MERGVYLCETGISLHSSNCNCCMLHFTWQCLFSITDILMDVLSQLLLSENDVINLFIQFHFKLLQNSYSSLLPSIILFYKTMEMSRLCAHSPNQIFLEFQLKLKVANRK